MNQKNFTTLVQEMAASVQGRAATLLDMNIGSILRAVVESVASVVLWLQSLILLLLATTRASTSAGTDLDSWMADYDFDRLPAEAASGSVTFSRFTATAQAVVPVGALVQNSDGSQKYAVTLDTANPAYSSTLDGYVMAIGVTSVIVTVQAQAAGAGGNALAGQINTLAQAMPGIDTVTNGSAFTSGVDAESDSDFRSRFRLYIASLSKGTMDAIAYAIESVSAAAQYSIVENEDYAGTPRLGYFYVVVDDGSGTPGPTYISNMANAIETVRPFTVEYDVYAPVVIGADVSMTVTVKTGYTAATVRAAVATALTSTINALGLGADLPYTYLSAIAYGVEGVENVSAVLLNGATADITATAKETIKADVITVS